MSRASLLFALVNLVRSRELLRLFLCEDFRDFPALKFFEENFIPPYYRRSLRLRRYYGNLPTCPFYFRQSLEISDLFGLLFVDVGKSSTCRESLWTQKFWSKFLVKDN